MSEMDGSGAVGGARSLEIAREMYALALEMARSEEPYYVVHGRKLGARLHHIILSQDPAADIGFYRDTHG